MVVGSLYTVVEWIGNRGLVEAGQVDAGPVTPDKAANGLLIYDTSEIQSRQANPQVKLVGKFLFNDGGGAQHTIPIKIEGKPYVVFVDETGPGGFGGVANLQASCDAGLPVFPMARLIDISDETAPKLVSRLGLETHDPANCKKVLPDLDGLAIFFYGSHYCSVDNKDKATTLACGYFNSGIRVFDIRDARRPKEIAYYNPAGTTTISSGSNHTLLGNWRSGGPDWCSFDVGGGKQLALHGQPKERADTRPFHLTLTTSDIAAAVADFQRAGAKVTTPIHDEPFGKLAILIDPEGRKFSIVQEQ